MASRPFFAAVAALLTFTLGLLLFRHPSASQSFSYPGFFSSGPGGRSLSSWVVDEDARYSVVLQDRQHLINRWTTSFESYAFPQISFNPSLTTDLTFLQKKLLKSLGQPMCVVPLPCGSVLLTWPLPGDFFIPSYQCPHRFERVGILGDGGKWVCGLDRVAKQDKCVIYSFGLPLLFHFCQLLSESSCDDDRCQRRVIVRIFPVEARTWL